MQNGLLYAPLGTYYITYLCMYEGIIFASVERSMQVLTYYDTWYMIFKVVEIINFDFIIAIICMYSIYQYLLYKNHT